MYSNVTGEAYVDTSQIVKLLPLQVRVYVKWHQIISKLSGLNKNNEISEILEVGPGGGQLGKLMQKTDNKLYQKYSYKF